MTRTATRRLVSLCAAVALSTLLVDSTSRAATLSLTPVSDGTLLDDNDNGIFESVDAASAWLLVRGGISGPQRRAGMEFDLSSISGATWVTSATLKLTFNTPFNTFGGTMSLHGYSGNGIIDTSDAYANSPISSFGYVHPSVHTANVTSFISNLVLSGNRFAGVTARATIDSGIGSQFASSEHTTAVNRPTLSISYDLNDSPSADAGGPYILQTGNLLTLNASSSSDPDTPYGDSLSLYQWDLDNDSVVDFTTANEQLSLTLAQYTPFFPTVGNYTVRLRVFDKLGLSGATSVSLELIPEPSSIGLATLGFTAVLAYRHRRKRR